MAPGVRSKKEMQEQLEQLYPRPPPPNQLSRLYNRWRKLCTRPVCYPTMAEEVHCVMQALRWHRLPSQPPSVVLDPCAGTCALVNELASWLTHLPLQFTSNDIHVGYPTTHHLDATLPSCWERLPQPDLIVSSPPFELLDIMLPEFVARARIATILHVPGDYLSNGPQHRRQLWRYLEGQRCTAMVEGLPRVHGRPMRRCAWLFVFSSPEWKDLLWRPPGDRWMLTQAA